MSLTQYKINLTEDLISELTDVNSDDPEGGIIVKAVKTDGSGETLDINIINTGNIDLTVRTDDATADPSNMEPTEDEIGNINPEEQAAMDAVKQEIVAGENAFESRGFKSKNTISSFDEFLKS